MNKNAAHYKSLLGFTFIGGLLFFGCDRACAPAPKEPHEAKPNKSVVTYTLTKLNSAETYRLGSDEIRDLVSSTNGQFLYVIGKNNASLKVLDVEKNTWDDALADFKGIENALNRKSAGDLSNTKVENYSAFSEGLVFSLSGNNGLVVLRGSGAGNASYYPQGHASFPKTPFKPMIATVQGERYLYLFDTSSAADGVRFRKYVDPPTLDKTQPGIFDTSLRKNNGAPLTHVFVAGAQDEDGNLFLADREGIKRLRAEDIGKANKVLDSDGKTIYAADSFRLRDMEKNDQITAMALVDKRYLVVGLKSLGSNSGGIAVLDITKPDAAWQTFGEGRGISVQSIATERIKDPERTRISAVVVTDKGFLILGEDGKPMEPVKGKGVFITGSVINSNRAETKNYDTAIDGFLGDRVTSLNESYQGAAQTRNGLWYLAFGHVAKEENGIFVLDIKIDQAEFKKPLEIPEP